MIRRVLNALAFVVGLGLVVLTTWFAARRTTDSQQVATVNEPVTVVVTEATLGRSLTVGVQVERQVFGQILSPSEGVITRVPDELVVASGVPLMWIDEVPLVVVEGAVPAFRDMADGASGDDVTQLQEFLIESGYLPGDSVDGRFGSVTRAAVKKWEASLVRADKPDGVVSRNEMVFLAELPAVGSLPDDVDVGSSVMAGDAIVDIIDSTPTFSAVVDQPQLAEEILVGMVTDIELPSGETLRSTVAGRSVDPETKHSIFELAPESTCDSGCKAVTDEKLLTATLEVVPETSGAAVPLRAIQLSASGEPEVLGVDGDAIAVTVVIADNGVAIVDGLSVGDEVLVPDAGDITATSGSGIVDGE